jgi:hypothetical protein
MSLRHILVPFLIAALVVASATRAAAPADEPAAPPAVEEKAIWGVLVKIVTSSAFSAFKNWLLNRLTGDDATERKPGTGTLAQNSQTLEQAVIAQVSEYTSAGMTRLLDSLFANKTGPVVEEPRTALKVENGESNFQGVHIALVGADRRGRLAGFRAVNEGFRTGERFKLRVVATFDGLLTVANVNPRNERIHIYPPGRDRMVSIKAGEEVFIPLGKDEFFQFAGSKGTEQLVLSVADPRALEGRASPRPVYRQDEEYGSNFVQEVTPQTFPAVSQSISLIHY